MTGTDTEHIEGTTEAATKVTRTQIGQWTLACCWRKSVLLELTAIIDPDDTEEIETKGWSKRKCPLSNRNRTARVPNTVVSCRITVSSC